MTNKGALTSEERLEILEALKRGSQSHHEIAKRFGRAQSTISKLARDAGITPTHRRRRSPAAQDLEGSFTREERIRLTDRVLGVIGALVEGGGLNPRELREITQALKQTLDARRAEDTEPDSQQSKERELWPLGLGEMAIDASTPLGRELREEFTQREGEEEGAWHEEEYRRAVEERKQGRP
jgi:transposase